MINQTFIAVVSYSIAFAAVIGLIRLPRLPRAYQPFIFITILSLVNEVISHTLILHRKSNAVAINIFGLIDAVLWFWQFANWNIKSKRLMIIKATFITLILLWVVENIIFRKLFTFGCIYPITLSFLIVIFSAIQLGREIAQEKGNLLVSPKFLICCGTILFYTYRILVECFYVPGISKSNIFFGNVFIILSFVNFIVNLLFALAVLWIPEKQKFSVPYY
jgi:hypothetical protein